MIFIIDWALDDSEIRKREKFAISKKKSAGGLLHDLEGKPDVDRLGGSHGQVMVSLHYI